MPERLSSTVSTEVAPEVNAETPENNVEAPKLSPQERIDKALQKVNDALEELKAAQASAETGVDTPEASQETEKTPEEVVSKVGAEALGTDTAGDALARAEALCQMTPEVAALLAIIIQRANAANANVAERHATSPATVETDPNIIGPTDEYSVDYDTSTGEIGEAPLAEESEWDDREAYAGNEHLDKMTDLQRRREFANDQRARAETRKQARRNAREAEKIAGKAERSDKYSELYDRARRKGRALGGAALRATGRGIKKGFMAAGRIIKGAAIGGYNAARKR